ncbi:cytochrome P450 [Microdochium trichocladiopsis]|uniref:Cytochrome P450 n=1 Tax=Microdochium trichocladiopsis TaxID=1682393 RepID=A0A9P8YA05_9PEZI|nr:cytochrome P450 [Microdochium trichocladiopsis]KAH7031686.1 cytochrome P450 [Microdochium trichocladiopsis]
MALLTNLIARCTLPAMVLLALAGVIVYYSGVIVYRLYFHPLAKFPGPKLAAASWWYETYHELIKNGGSQFTPHIRDLHARYGPIVRITPDELSIADAEFHDRLYAPQPAVRDRHPSFSAALGTLNGCFSTNDHYLHRQRRAAVNAFYSPANLAAFEPLAQQRVDHLCNLLWEHRGQVTPLRTYCAALSFDSFYSWAFGNPLRLLDDLDKAEMINKTVEKLVTSPPVYKCFPSAMRAAKLIPSWILVKLSRDVANAFELQAMVAREAERFVASAEDATDVEKRGHSVGAETLFSVIGKSRIPGEEKTASRITQEGTEMLMASFTPGRSMMNGVYFLGAFPDVLTKLQAELAEAFSDPKVAMDFKTLSQLPYLNAVVKETLRAGFPISSRLPMIAHETMQFQEWEIPAYTAMSVNHRGLLFDETVFPDPHAFKPERWLDTEHPIDAKRYFVPFGKGSRGCPGREFATHLIRLMLARFAQRFVFELADTDWDRDVKVVRESLLTASAHGSTGVKVVLLDERN